MTEIASDDPFEEHLRRDPLPNAGIRVVLLAAVEGETGDDSGASLVELIAASGRPVERCDVSVGDDGLGPALERSLQGASLPLVLVTTAAELWTKAHLEPLLEAIDQCDHVIGCRPRGSRGHWVGALGMIARRLIFALPLRDIHSPCRLHRLEKLAAIPLQSTTTFLDTEILAKATFLGHLIDEVAVPPLRSRAGGNRWWRDWNQVVSHPRFVRPSRPAEELECQREGHNGPGRQDDHRRTDVE